MSVASIPISRELRPSGVRRLAMLVAGLGALGAAGTGQAQAPGFTAAQAKRGAEFYAGSCAQCHGDNLDDGQFAPALKGSAHAAYWKGKSAADMFSYMSSTMPPTQPGGLGGQAYADVMAYILQTGGAPPGDKELPADPAPLRGAAPTP